MKTPDANKMYIVHIYCPTVPFRCVYREKITFRAIKSLIFNGSCSNFEYMSLEMGHIFLQSLNTISSKIKISTIYLSLK